MRSSVDIELHNAQQRGFSPTKETSNTGFLFFSSKDYIVDEKYKLHLADCPHCKSKLKPHPLYSEFVAKTCVNCGDFFLQEQRGYSSQIIFRSFEYYDASLSMTIDETVKPTVIAGFIRRSNGQVGAAAYILQCDQTGEIFKSLGKASKFAGAYPKAISNHLRGIRRDVNGYTFTKLGTADDAELKPEERPEFPRKTRRDLQKKPIRCNQTGHVYESIGYAAKHMGLNEANISKHLNGHQSHVRKYTFSWATESEITHRRSDALGILARRS